MATRQVRDIYPVGRLFAAATVALEKAGDVAVAGQKPRLTTAQQRRILQRLTKAIDRCQDATQKIATELNRKGTNPRT